MDTIDKYLTESKEKDYLKTIDQRRFSTIKDEYNSVADYIVDLAKEINLLNGDSGLFGDDLKNIVKARDAFNKVTLGKYL